MKKNIESSKADMEKDAKMGIKEDSKMDKTMDAKLPKMGKVCNAPTKKGGC